MQIKRNDKNLVAANFTAAEFFTKSVDFTGNEHYLNEKLIFASQLVRNFLRYSVAVNSTYRTYLGNQNSGGAVGSLHLKGEAIDLQTGSETERIQNDFETKGALYHSLRSIGIGGFGVGVNMIHLDTRKSGNSPDNINGSYALWYYAGVKKNGFSQVDSTTDSTEATPQAPINKIYLVVGGVVLVLLLILKKNGR